MGIAGQRTDRALASNRQEARDTDRELVARTLGGDQDAFGAIYDRHATRLYSLAYRMLGSPADAEDLLQETFFQAYRKLGSFKGESALGTWLYRLAVNLCLDHLRSRQGRTAQMTSPLDEENDAAMVTATPLRDPVTRLDLEHAIAQLPDRCRAAFLLHDVDGFEHGEVGELLDIAEGTSKSLVHKARLRIRVLLGAARVDDRR